MLVSVAVAVMKLGGRAGVGNLLVNVVIPVGPIMTRLVVLMTNSPSPYPEGSTSELPKYSISFTIAGMPSIVPITVICVPLFVAESRTGKFCRLFAPESASSKSFAV